MIGPSPIDTVGNCQKPGMSHGCGYEERPFAVDLLAEVAQLLLGDAPFEKRPGVDPRRAVPLDVEEVAAEIRLGRAEEVVEADVVERRRRGEARDVPAELRARAVGLHDHGQGVPADDRADAVLEPGLARNLRLFGRG